MAAAAEFHDEFSSYLNDAKRDPAFRAAYEDAQETHRVLDSLTALRRALRLTQSEVAARMGVRQPSVSEFENEASDPRLSTLQRYARAVEARLRLVVDMPADCDWVTPSVSTYSLPQSEVSGSRRAPVRHGPLARQWRPRDNRGWDLAA